MSNELCVCKREWKKIREENVKYEIFGVFLEPANLKEVLYLQLSKQLWCWSEDTAEHNLPH